MMNPLAQLVNKIFVVTGAANGIGYETVRLLLRWRARVIAVDKDFDTDAPHWQDMPDGDVYDAEGRPTFLMCKVDLRAPGDVETFWREVIKEAHDLSVDGLVNSAGVSLVEWAERIEYADYMNVLETNLAGAFMMSREFIRHVMSDRARDSWRFVVNEGSLGSDQAFRGGAAYVSSKAGLKAMTRQMAREQRGQICFTCIQPETLAGPSKISEYVINRLVETRGEYEAKEHRCGEVKDRETAEGYFRGTPEFGDWQTCEEIARLTLFCLTDWAVPLSGSALQCLDGRT